jgi:protein O-mannosyl-transferase
MLMKKKRPTLTSPHQPAGPLFKTAHHARRLAHPGLIILVLVATVLAVYRPVLGYDFTNMDDPEYFSDNLHVLDGFTLENIKWAFQTGYTGYWQPPVWLSYMADVTMSGKGPTGPHLVNVLLHAANAVLVFLLLRQMTGALWRSASVGAFFALHPLRVESVAWITERKDVLSAFFGFLSLFFYARYAVMDGKPSGSKGKKYFLVLFFFALAVMSKPMLVTLPFIMLLLDYWPLHRVRLSPENSKGKPALGLVVEKAPLFLLSAIFSIVTFHLQTKAGAVVAAGGPPLDLRLQNAFVSFGRYLANTFWPVNLACPYPFQPHLSRWAVGSSALLMAILCWCVCWSGRKRPWLFSGWFWFFGALLPVIGLIQSGQQSMADRFTYLPSVGLFIALTWGASEFSWQWKLPRMPVFFGAALILVACGMQTRIQLGCWQNSETLFTHALAVTKNNYIAHYNLGLAYFQQERIAEAIEQYQQALGINPDDSDAHNNLGTALLSQGRLAEGTLQFQKALANNPKNTDAYVNLGNTCFQQGRVDEAITNYEHALELNPEIAEAHNNLGSALFQKGRLEEALSHLQRALEINPRYPSAQINLAWLLATSSKASIRNGPRAVEYAQLAHQTSGGDNPVILRTLAAAYAENGRFSDAVVMAQKALQLAMQQNNPQLTVTIQMQLKYYEAGNPYREN